MLMPLKKHFLKTFITVITAVFFLYASLAQAIVSPTEITGSTTITLANEVDFEDGVIATDGAPGDFLIIENGVVILGHINFAEFPYELFNRGAIVGGFSPGVECDSCIVNNDGTAAQILSPDNFAVLISGDGEVVNSGQSAEIIGFSGGGWH